MGKNEDFFNSKECVVENYAPKAQSDNYFASDVSTLEYGVLENDSDLDIQDSAKVVFTQKQKILLYIISLALYVHLRYNSVSLANIVSGIIELFFIAKAAIMIVYMVKFYLFHGK